MFYSTIGHSSALRGAIENDNDPGHFSTARGLPARDLILFYFNMEHVRSCPRFLLFSQFLLTKYFGDVLE